MHGRTLVLALGLCCAMVASARAEHAAAPSYLVLQLPSGPAHAPLSHYRGQTSPVQATAYSYGWFGAAPRTHAGRSFGYYRNYTQWRQW